MPKNCQTVASRRFEFARDTFAFENETFWEYHFDAAAGKTSFSRREPKPSYAHRCFVLTRAARQFLYHARFDAEQKAPDDLACRRLIGKVVARNPRRPCAPDKQIVIPGYANLREFSGRGLVEGRMRRSVAVLCFAEPLADGVSDFAHVPSPHRRVSGRRAQTKWSADHSPGKIPGAHHQSQHDSVCGGGDLGGGIDFQAYDPNNPMQPTRLSFDRKTSTFSLPPNHYWAGGELDIIEIYRTWLM